MWQQDDEALVKFVLKLAETHIEHEEQHFVDVEHTLAMRVTGSTSLLTILPAIGERLENTRCVSSSQKSTASTLFFLDDDHVGRE
jgi:hypothetical protein